MATLGDLCGLLCRAGCSIGAAAATLAFHPPEPSYAVGRHPSGGLVWALSERLAKVSAPLTEVDVIRSRSGSRIPIFVVRYPGASLTLLFAHGNATDCGLARAGLIDLCVNLRCNVAAYEYSGYGAATGACGVSDAGNRGRTSRASDALRARGGLGLGPAPRARRNPATR